MTVLKSPSRPPGHHAASSICGGYCFFNNIAVAARFIQTTSAQAARIAILDIDYHHGNGCKGPWVGLDRGEFTHKQPRRFSTPIRRFTTCRYMLRTIIHVIQVTRSLHDSKTTQISLAPHPKLGQMRAQVTISTYHCLEEHLMSTISPLSVQQPTC